jgi:hypothetical protein
LNVQIVVGLSLLCLPAVASGDSEPESKYVIRRGNDCQPTGALKELLSGKYKCDPEDGPEKCAASVEAAKGSIDPAFLELFGDLLKMNEYGFPLDLPFCEMSRTWYIQSLAVGGIGYAKATAHLDALAALGSVARLAKRDAAGRDELLRSLGHFGDAHRAKILPVLKNALQTPGSMLSFKKNALKLLARFGSDDGIGYCLDVLRNGTDGSVAKMCGWYLAERNHVAAAPLLIRGLEERETRLFFTRALGILGSKDAVELLKEQYAKYMGSPAETVALLNIGDKSYDYAGDLVLMIRGKSPLSLKERAQKAEELKTKKKGVAAKWQKLEDESLEEERVARVAAIEATFATDAVAGKAIDAALKKTAAKTNWATASTFALSALAQRGDKDAVASLVSLLSSPKKDVREIALKAFGAQYDDPEAYLEYLGRKGLVADPTVPPALFKFIESEPKKEDRAKALLAVGAVQSFL